jgi:hypothetical protein
MEQNVCSFYEVIDAFRARPEVYVGSGDFRKDPFAIFQAFLSGLTFANLDEGSPPFWSFERWLAVRVEESSPRHQLVQKLGSKGAYEEYLRLLDEYRTCREIEVATVARELIAPRFLIDHGDGNRHAPAIPQKLYVGQFAPSDIYFVAAVDNESTQRDFPYHRTIESAIEAAVSHWGVPVTAWQRA